MLRIVLALLVFSLLASPALASEPLGDRDVSFLSLKVNGRGEALVSYTTSRTVRDGTSSSGAQ